MHQCVANTQEFWQPWKSVSCNPNISIRVLLRGFSFSPRHTVSCSGVTSKHFSQKLPVSFTHKPPAPCGNQQASSTRWAGHTPDTICILVDICKQPDSYVWIIKCELFLQPSYLLHCHPPFMHDHWNNGDNKVAEKGPNTYPTREPAGSANLLHKPRSLRTQEARPCMKSHAEPCHVRRIKESCSAEAGDSLGPLSLLLAAGLTPAPRGAAWKPAHWFKRARSEWSLSQ